ncbi:MAG: LptF/LptG family permease [Bacillota bacterium]|nr:LptF/LptG family permease [Bacillota bacterium]
MDRYVAREFCGPFIACVGGFVMIMLAGQLFWLAELIIVKKVAALAVARMLLYKLPDAVVQSLPVATLFGALLAVTRLSRDSELSALRASGARIPRLLLPLLGISLLVSVLTFWLNERVVPWTNHQYENIVRKLVLQEALPSVEENVFFRGTQDRFFYVREVHADDGSLRDVMIYEVRSDRLPRIITARRGFAKGTIWILEDGVVHDLDSDGYVAYEALFKAMTIEMDQGLESFFGEQKTPAEMSRAELGEHIALFRRSGIEVNALVVDYDLKLSLPLASLVFVFAGTPLAITGPRSGRLFGAAVSGGVALSYYVLSSVLRSLGCNEVLPPLAAAWIPNVVFAAAGMLLMMRSEKVR